MWCWIATNMWGSESGWFWTMAQGIAVTVTLIFIYSQLKAQRLGNILSVAAHFRERWNSEDMLQGRRVLCEKYGNMADLSINQQEGLVLDFFEEMGLYLKLKVISREIVWEMYSSNIEHYWPIAEPLITEYRNTTNDVTPYRNFETLYQDMKTESIKNKLSPVGKTQQQITQFIAGETQKF